MARRRWRKCIERFASNGERCVIKVLRPGIEKTVRLDLEIMAQIAGLLERHVEGWSVHKPTDLVEEFARRMEQEMDFRAEAAHIRRFSDQFATEPTIYVPKVFSGSFHPARSYDGIDRRRQSVGFRSTSKRAGLDRRIVATRIADLVMKQIFVHGFFTPTRIRATSISCRAMSFVSWILG